ncbi:AP2-like DNA-binding integrase domain-containing protein [Enterococcus malodoratus]|uniref:tyrosine-type recombinase/integrase n=1 Tax=Enterococcus malodoratus TaxID=71451 RepID=UPI0008C5FE71|nr:site-specific integrase [Enterococcus malodoratus]SET33531.1 AP2-like DNA-binding integrase domain-containing protein [Enterococcus malodoratus]
MSGYFKQYTKKNGSKAWMFNSLYLGVDTSGKKVRVTRRGFPTLKSAKLEATKLRTEFNNGKYDKKTTENTFQEIYELWFDSYKKTVKESTSIATERYVTLHVLPTFGSYKLNQITPKMAQQAVNEWADKLQVYKVILQYVVKIMDFAINLGLIEVNPFDKVIRPKVKKTRKEKEVKFYTVEEVQKVMKVLEDRVFNTNQANKLYYFFALFDQTFYRLLAFSGLRGGEALALTWKDIDFEEKTLTVSKNLSQTKNGFAVSSPKTKSSYRTISLDDKTIRILKRWQLKEKELLFSNRVKDCEIVFPDLNGQYLNRQNIYMRSQRVAKFAGLPDIGTHGWRHTHASMLFEAGASMKEAQVRLGHSSIEMTMNIYTHVTKKVTTETATKLAKFANF